MSKLVKPKKTVRRNYDWRDAEKYLEAKYKIDLRDYKGKLKKGADPNTPYCDFWHWWIDQTEIHNGSYAYLSYDPIEDNDTPEWVKEILKLIFKEFGPKEADIEFYVYW